MYNMSLIEYPNGSAQIKCYSNPVGRDDFDPTLPKRENMVKKEALEVSKMFDIPLTDKSELLRVSFSRTRKMINQYARCAKWEYFCTLTFDPKFTDRTDFKLCMQRVRNWLQNQRKRYAPDLQFLCVPELHTKNMKKYGYCWHVHILMAQVGNMKMTDSGRKTKAAQTIYNLSGWHFGFSTAVPIAQGEEDIYRVQTYITKYMTKQAYVLSNKKGAHRYYVSKNLKVPHVKKYFIPPSKQDAFVDDICSKLDKDIVWTSNSSGYVDVKYYELQ